MQTNKGIKELKERDDFQAVLPLLRLLRPHLDEEKFSTRLPLARQEGYRLFALHDDSHKIRGVIGLRILHDLLDGRCLVIDDLVVQIEFRRQGVATKLVEFAKDFARQNDCFEIRLNSGFSRKEAHALYEAAGMKKTSYVYRVSIR